MEPIKINFTFNDEDWLAYHKHHLSSSRNRKKTRRKSMMTGVFVGLMFLTFVLMGKGDNVPFLFGLVVFSAISFAIPYFKRARQLQAAKTAARRPEISSNFGPQKVVFSDDAIVNTMPQLETTLKWEGVYWYEQNADYFFLYTSDTTAIIIPKKKIDADVQVLDALFLKKLNRL